MLVFWPPAKCWKIRFWWPAKICYFLITNPFQKFQFSAGRRGGLFQTSKGTTFYDCIWMYTIWGWNAYTMRLECLQHEAWMYTAWGLKVYSMTMYEAWKYTLWGLNVYSMRPESTHCEAWMYATWRLKAYAMRPESIHYEIWKYTFWGFKVYSMKLEGIHYEAWM